MNVYCTFSFLLLSFDLSCVDIHSHVGTVSALKMIMSPGDLNNPVQTYLQSKFFTNVLCWKGTDILNHQQLIVNAVWVCGKEEKTNKNKRHLIVGILIMTCSSQQHTTEWEHGKVPTRGLKFRYYFHKYVQKQFYPLLKNQKEHNC